MKSRILSALVVLSVIVMSADVQAQLLPLRGRIGIGNGQIVRPNLFPNFGSRFATRTYTQPYYGQWTYGQTTYTQPMMVQPTYAQPGIPQPNYQANFVPTYTQPGLNQTVIQPGFETAIAQPVYQQQFAQPQFAQPQFAQPQYTQPVVAPNFAQPVLNPYAQPIFDPYAQQLPITNEQIQAQPVIQAPPIAETIVNPPVPAAAPGPVPVDETQTIVPNANDVTPPAAEPPVISTEPMIETDSETIQPIEESKSEIESTPESNIIDEITDEGDDSEVPAATEDAESTEESFEDSDDSIEEIETDTAEESTDEEPTEEPEEDPFGGGGN